MVYSEINSIDDLSQRIDQLRKDKLRQEVELNVVLNEFAVSLNPLLMIKNSMHEVVVNKEAKDDLLKVGLNLGTNFIIEKILKRHTLKGYLSSIIVEKISTSVINSGALSGIIASFSKLVKRKSEYAKTHDAS
jgi:hypothetical protein